jgi:hypothetical protein
MRLALAAVLALLAPTSASAALTTVAPGPATGLTTYGGPVVWEHREADGSYRLVADVNGAIADLPVAASRRPFGADLGPGPAGGVSAVYQRCTSACRAYRFDFATGTEKPIHAPIPAGCRIEALSIWRDELAASASHCKRAAVYVRLGSHTRRLGTAPKHAPILFDVEAGPRRVAWFSTLDTEAGPNDRVRFADLSKGGRTRTAWMSGPSGDSIQTEASLSFDGSHLSWYWSTICDGCDFSHVVRVDRATGRHEASVVLADDDPAHSNTPADSIALTPQGVLFTVGYDLLDQPLPNGI